MTYLEFAGCSMIAFGPALSMFVTTIAKDPIRIIILISAAFFWLLSLLVSSFIWFFMSFIDNYLIVGIIVSILVQELFRFLLYKLIRNAEKGLQKVSEIGSTNRGSVITTNRTVLAYVCGLGFGVMSGAFSLFNILADSIGPGTIGINGDSNLFFLSSSFITLAFILLHVFWGIIFFKGCDTKSKTLIIYVIISHLIASKISLLNQSYPYILSISLTYLLTIITGLIASTVSGCSINSIKSALNH